MKQDKLDILYAEANKLIDEIKSKFGKEIKFELLDEAQKNGLIGGIFNQKDLLQEEQQLQKLIKAMKDLIERQEILDETQKRG